jgi:Mrp family chromosome partitioning ATPase
MTTLLGAWREKFAHVVIDSPPILPVSDALVLAPLVDAVILVARFGVTDLQSIKRAMRLLHDVHAARTSVLMNGVDVRSPEYYRYAGTSGYSEYGNGENYLFVNADADAGDSRPA